MRLHRIMIRRLMQMVGDCRCGHSVIYHAPFVGCVKCDCDEFH